MKYRHLIILSAILVLSLMFVFLAWGFHNLFTFPVTLQFHDTSYAMQSWNALLLLFAVLSLGFYLIRQLMKLFHDITGNWILIAFCLFFIWLFWAIGNTMDTLELEILAEQAAFLTEEQLAAKPGNSANLMARVGLTAIATLCLSANLIRILKKRRASN